MAITGFLVLFAYAVLVANNAEFASLAAERPQILAYAIFLEYVIFTCLYRSCLRQLIAAREALYHFCVCFRCCCRNWRPRRESQTGLV